MTQDRQANGNGGQDERTPLLKNRSDQNGDAASQRSGSSSSSDGSSGDSLITDLGDFTIQPSELSRAIAEKDLSALLKLPGEQHGSADELFQALQSDREKGLQQDQCEDSDDGDGGADERIRVYGRNKLPEKEMKPFWRFLWEAFNDKVLIILTVAAAVSFGLGLYQDFGPQHPEGQPRVEWVEGVAIMAAIVIVTLTSSVNDYSKERQFKALNDTKEIPTVKVLRDGKKYNTIPSTEVLVGDIVYVEPGSILTCDGLVLSMKHEIKVDESDATGESDAISKVALDDVQKRAKDASSKKQGDYDEQEDDSEDAFLLSGSKILEGDGIFLVLAVGVSSFQGKIFMSLRSSQPDQTRMQKQLASLAERIAKLASLAGAILFVCLFIRNCVMLRMEPDRTPAEKVQGFIQSFVISVTLIVVAVPEGLPLAVTLALAFATNRMTQHNLLVRVFEACETMSNANVVVTDKTGTLTANEMRVVEGTIGGTAFTLREGKAQDQETASDNSNSDRQGGEELPVGDVKKKSQLLKLLEKNQKLKHVLAQSVAINSTAFDERKEKHKKLGKRQDTSKGHKPKDSGKVKKQKNHGSGQGKGSSSNQQQDDDEDDDGPNFVGNKTESALLHMMEVELVDVREKTYSDIREAAETVLVLPFNSDRKAMAVVAKVPNSGDSDQDTTYRLYVKGAAEVIVGLCTRRAQLETEGGEGSVETEDIDDDKRQKVQELVDGYAKRSLRTIAIAYRDFEEWPPSGAGESNEEGDDKGKIKYEDIAKELTLVAIPAIEDPLRPGVENAVEKCRRAGVSVKMCTGDNLLTAQAIAKQCGIYKDDGLVISGSDWRKLSEEEQREKAPKLQVMARSLPQDKETLVKALQDSGRIVGVTGDGTNDALALKTGDVGFSMGKAGTEIAKEASDVIIMDDNFTSLVGAISWGRCVSDAVRKFLQFQLAVNITAIVITFVSSVTGGDDNSIMNAVQLLWVNLIMDTFAALALATDPADDSLLDRKPEPRDTPIITATMTKMIIAQSAYQIAITLALHFMGPKALRPITKSGQEASAVEFGTLVFNIFVWCQIFNMINCRKLDNHFNVFSGLWRNLWLMGILSIMVGGQILIVFFGGAAFDTKPISPIFWAVSIGAGAGSLVIGFLVRLIPDGPLQRLMIKLNLLPDHERLPSSRSAKKQGVENDKEDDEDMRGKPFKYLRSIRSGRFRANTNLHDWLHGVPPPTTKGRVPQVFKGLVLVPAMAARQMAGVASNEEAA